MLWTPLFFLGHLSGIAISSAVVLRQHISNSCASSPISRRTNLWRDILLLVRRLDSIIVRHVQRRDSGHPTYGKPKASWCPWRTERWIPCWYVVLTSIPGDRHIVTCCTGAICIWSGGVSMLVCWPLWFYHKTSCCHRCPCTNSRLHFLVSSLHGKAYFLVHSEKMILGQSIRTFTLFLMSGNIYRLKAFIGDILSLRKSTLASGERLW